MEGITLDNFDSRVLVFDAYTKPELLLRQSATAE